MSHKEDLFEANKTKFLKYAEKLFDYILPPTKDSLKLSEIDISNKIETGILYELVSYGFQRKMFEFSKATETETYKKDLYSNPEKMFNFIAEYMKATGYYPILESIEKDSNGNLSNINMKFSKT